MSEFRSRKAKMNIAFGQRADLISQHQRRARLFTIRHSTTPLVFSLLCCCKIIIAYFFIARRDLGKVEARLGS